MIAQAGRYFGQSPDYWEDHLTMRRLTAHRKVLARDPPAEFFLAAYFIGREWWVPSSRGQAAPPDADTQLPKSDLPEFEP